MVNLREGSCKGLASVDSLGRKDTLGDVLHLLLIDKIGREHKRKSSYNSRDGLEDFAPGRLERGSKVIGSSE